MSCDDFCYALHDPVHAQWLLRLMNTDGIFALSSACDSDSSVMSGQSDVAQPRIRAFGNCQ